MADSLAVKWSTLFPKTGGSGRGGAFTGKVFSPAMSPYTAANGDRLVIPTPDQIDPTQQLIIDPSGLGIDEAFQVIDASRKFDKRPVTIKGDKVAIQIVGTGNDLILDMIGAGNLWEFIVGDDGNGGKLLLVADSPGYTGDLSGGGGSSPAQPSAPGSGNGAVVYYGGNQNPEVASFRTDEEGQRDIVYLQFDSAKDDDGSLTDMISIAWIWPKGVHRDGEKQWKPVPLLNSEDIQRIQREHSPLYIGYGDPVATTASLDDLNFNLMSLYINLDNAEMWSWPAKSEAKPGESLWQKIKGSGGGGSAPAFDKDDFLKKYIDPGMLMRAPLFVGQADPNLDTSLEVGGNLDSLYLNTATGQWFMWPNNNMIVEIDKDGKATRRPDAVSLWKPVTSGFNQKNFAATGNNPAITAMPGDLLVVNFTDGADGILDYPITLPTPQLGDRPISVVFTGGLSRTPVEEQATVMSRDAEIVITSPVPIVGAWDDFESGDKSINLDMAGELIEFSPFTFGDSTAWLITNSNYVSEDAHMKVITANYAATMGDSIIFVGAGTITLPTIEDEKDLDPITIVYTYRNDIVDVPPWLKVIGVVDGVGGQDPIKGNYNGKVLAMNPESKEGQPTAFVMADGDWVTLTPYKLPATGAFWLITGSGAGSPATANPVNVQEISADVTAVQGQTYIARQSVGITLPKPDLSDARPVKVVIYPALEITTTYQVEIKTDAVDNPDSATYRGISGFIQGDGKKDNKQALVISGYCAWVRLEPCGTVNDPFWLIADGWTEATQ